MIGRITNQMARGSFRGICIALVCGCAVILAQPALAWVQVLPPSLDIPPVYSGSVSNQNPGPWLVGFGNWITGGTTRLSWTVGEVTDGVWSYSYSLTHPTRETDRFILETSSTFTRDHMTNIWGDFGDWSIDSWSAGADRFGLPSTVYGIQFYNMFGLTSTINFTSDRAPMWGDFYARSTSTGLEKCTYSAVWNKGFGNPDSDPTSPAANGSLLNHILVPDTFSNPIPEPGSLLLLGSGLVGTALFAVRRRR